MKKLNFLLVIFTLCSLLSAAYCNPEEQIPNWKQIYANSLHGDLTWTTQPWTVDEKPYLKVRNDVAAMWKAKRLTRNTVKWYRQIALWQTSDPVNLFRWAYGSYCLALSHTDSSDGSGEVSEVFQYMRNRQTPASYQFTRVRYFIAQYSGSMGTKLNPLGERLLRYDPKDDAVKKRLIVTLRAGEVEDEQKALQYAREMLRANPKEAWFYSQLGNTIQFTSVGRKSKSNLRDGIWAYRQALALSHAPGEWRKGVQHSIASLQKLLLKAKLP